jgi:tRNA A37 threonylcarbamoyladenosine dehydratase
VSDFEFRFGGIARLFGTAGLQRLRNAHVCVVGIGGVGSWSVEAFARSGVGALTLVDLDDICVSNVNRQLHALDSAIGAPKVAAMAERVRGINAECKVTAVPEFFTGTNADTLLGTPFDCVLDAIDNVAAKCQLIAGCRARGIPIVTCGGAGGRRDPTRIRVADLAQTSHDRLLQKVREQLRKDFGFPRDGKRFGIDCVFSAEPQVFPQCDGSVGTTREEGADLRLNCASGFGSATFVTGAFGFAAAGVIVSRIAEGAFTPA